MMVATLSYRETGSAHCWRNIAITLIDPDCCLESCSLRAVLAKFLPVVVRPFLPDLSFVDEPSIADLPRLALGFFLFRHFGFQVASVLARRNLPSLSPKLANECLIVSSSQQVPRQKETGKTIRDSGNFCQVG
jgi:hypothetical protein